MLNPFTQRGPIRDPHKFAGRWGELSLIFQSIERRQPVFVAGSPGIGKTSLLTHVVQAAAVNLERFDLRAFSLDLAVAQSEPDVYRVIIEALAKRGDSPVALERALAETDGPTLLCLDNAHAIVGSDWGEPMLDTLVRLARYGMLMLVAAQNGEPPILSERVAVVRLGAFASSEVRIFADTYLEGTGVHFTARNMRQLYKISQGHPSYLQRAAYHLFEYKLNPEYDWIAAYRKEVESQPVPGAPLPPVAFEGIRDAEADFAEGEGAAEATKPPTFEIEAIDNRLLYAVLVLLGLLIALISGNIWLASAIVLGGLAAVALTRYWWRFRTAQSGEQATSDTENC